MTIKISHRWLKNYIQVKEDSCITNNRKKKRVETTYSNRETDQSKLKNLSQKSISLLSFLIRWVEKKRTLKEKWNNFKKNLHKKIILKLWNFITTYLY